MKKIEVVKLRSDKIVYINSVKGIPIEEGYNKQNALGDVSRNIKNN